MEQTLDCSHFLYIPCTDQVVEGHKVAFLDVYFIAARRLNAPHGLASPYVREFRSRKKVASLYEHFLAVGIHIRGQDTDSHIAASWRRERHLLDSHIALGFHHEGLDL